MQTDTASWRLRSAWDILGVISRVYTVRRYEKCNRRGSRKARDRALAVANAIIGEADEASARVHALGDDGRRGDYRDPCRYFDSEFHQSARAGCDFGLHGERKNDCYGARIIFYRQPEISGEWFDRLRLRYLNERIHESNTGRPGGRFRQILHVRDEHDGRRYDVHHYLPRRTRSEHAHDDNRRRHYGQHKDPIRQPERFYHTAVDADVRFHHSRASRGELRQSLCISTGFRGGKHLERGALRRSEIHCDRRSYGKSKQARRT